MTLALSALASFSSVPKYIKATVLWLPCLLQGMYTDLAPMDLTLLSSKAFTVVRGRFINLALYLFLFMSSSLLNLPSVTLTNFPFSRDTAQLFVRSNSLLWCLYFFILMYAALLSLPYFHSITVIHP